METLILGGFVSAANISGFRRVFRKLPNSSVFPANPNVVHVSPLVPGINPNLLNLEPHLDFAGGGNDPRNGSGSGGQGGGYNKHNHGNDDHSGHLKSGLVLLGMLALFQGLDDEGKLFERKLVYETLGFLISQWVLTTPLAYAHATILKDESSVVMNGHAQESDGMDQENEGAGSMRSEDSEETLKLPVHRVHATYEDLPINDQNDEPFFEGLDLNRALNVDGSCEMALQPEEMKVDELEKQVQLEKQTFIRGNGRKKVDLLSATVFDHPLQVIMGWLEQLGRPAIAEQVTSFESTSKAEQVEQQESRVLSSEVATTVLEADSETGGKPLGAKQSDIDTLKRLQREAFSELMKLREKLDKLEQVTQACQKLERLGAARTHLKGQVKAGTAFVVLEDESSRHSQGSLERAGMQTGLDVKFTFETPFRESDVLITQVLSGQSSSVGSGRALGGPLNLGKLHYVAHVNDDISLSFVPLGAQGQDVTEIVNVLQDQGLTSFSSQGPALFNHCKGSALGATMSGSKFAFSFAQYLSGWGNHVLVLEPVSEEEPLCHSTLCQFLLQPTEGFILSICGVNRYWPTPPLPSSMAMHWSEIGPLVFPRIKAKKAGCCTTCLDVSSGSHMNRLHPHWETPDLECGQNAFQSKGTGLLSLAVSSLLDLGENLSLSGWAQVERGELIQEPNKGNFQWALSLAKTSGTGIDWGASIGGSQHDMWHMSSSSYDDEYSGYDSVDSHGPQLHAEAFLKLSCGKGFTLQPGLLYVSNKSSHTPAFVVRSSWSL